MVIITRRRKGFLRHNGAGGGHDEILSSHIERLPPDLTPPRRDWREKGTAASTSSSNPAITPNAASTASLFHKDDAGQIEVDGMNEGEDSSGTSREQLIAELQAFVARLQKGKDEQGRPLPLTFPSNYDDVVNIMTGNDLREESPPLASAQNQKHHLTRSDNEGGAEKEGEKEGERLAPERPWTHYLIEEGLMMDEEKEEMEGELKGEDEENEQGLVDLKGEKEEKEKEASRRRRGKEREALLRMKVEEETGEERKERLMRGLAKVRALDLKLSLTKQMANMQQRDLDEKTEEARHKLEVIVTSIPWEHLPRKSMFEAYHLEKNTPRSSGRERKQAEEDRGTRSVPTSPLASPVSRGLLRRPPSTTSTSTSARPSSSSSSRRLSKSNNNQKTQTFVTQMGATSSSSSSPNFFSKPTSARSNCSSSSSQYSGRNNTSNNKDFIRANIKQSKYTRKEGKLTHEEEERYKALLNNPRHNLIFSSLTTPMDEVNEDNGEKGQEEEGPASSEEVNLLQQHDEKEAKGDKREKGRWTAWVVDDNEEEEEEENEDDAGSRLCPGLEPLMEEEEELFGLTEGNREVLEEIERKLEGLKGPQRGVGDSMADADEHQQQGLNGGGEGRGGVSSSLIRGEETGGVEGLWLEALAEVRGSTEGNNNQQEQQQQQKTNKRQSKAVRPASSSSSSSSSSARAAKQEKQQQATAVGDSTKRRHLEALKRFFVEEKEKERERRRLAYLDAMLMEYRKIDHSYGGSHQQEQHSARREVAGKNQHEGDNDATSHIHHLQASSLLFLPPPSPDFSTYSSSFTWPTTLDEQEEDGEKKREKGEGGTTDSNGGRHVAMQAGYRALTSHAIRSAHRSIRQQDIQHVLEVAQKELGLLQGSSFPSSSSSPLAPLSSPSSVVAETRHKVEQLLRDLRGPSSTRLITPRNSSSRPAPNSEELSSFLYSPAFPRNAAADEQTYGTAVGDARTHLVIEETRDRLVQESLNRSRRIISLQSPSHDIPLSEKLGEEEKGWERVAEIERNLVLRI